MEEQDKLRIEFVFAPEVIQNNKEMRTALIPYKQMEDQRRVIYNVPRTWEGFKTEMVGNLLKTNREVGQRTFYMALAYFSTDDNEIITDLQGMPTVPSWNMVVDGKPVRKYVKIGLRIFNSIDKGRKIFTVKGYVCDPRYSDPIIKVLDIYSIGEESGLLPDHFITFTR